MKRKTLIRLCFLALLLATVLFVQHNGAAARYYAESVYPPLASALSFFSALIPFAVGDLFIFLSVAGCLFYLVYGYIRKVRFTKILRRNAEYLVWVYVWFYVAWGLNYSQPGFYERMQLSPQYCTDESFERFATDYIELLNHSFTEATSICPATVRDEVIKGYCQISDSLKVHRPFRQTLAAKTMLFTPWVSKVGVTGSMGPFFGEFTLNGDLLPSQYPATYAHEMAHLLGITSEAEANFYAYQVCARSAVQGIRFSGYLSMLGYILLNAKRMLSPTDYYRLTGSIRPEIITLSARNREYWAAKYSPLIGSVQDWVYNLYLKGNKIASGRQNYSEAVQLLVAYDAYRRGASEPLPSTSEILH